MSVGKNSLARAGKNAAKAPAAKPAPEKKVVKASAEKEFAVVKVAADKIKAAAGIVKDARKVSAETVKKYGVLEPLLLWNDKGTLRILRGNGTLEACKKLQIAEIPAVIVEATAAEAKKLAASVNEKPAVIKTEAAKAKTCEKCDPIHEQKFKVVEKIANNSKLPTYLL